MKTHSSQYINQMKSLKFSSKKRYLKTIGFGRNSGFALISTISIMVLLLIVALAMLSLSTIEVRGSENARATEEARANARMALIYAIGELQKSSGQTRG